ncbi:MAG: hypothetical protein GEU26_14665 [Nitrososphaeraceae archaeon]|nr:hypothetical protein [Nitrososphaeraceae archaeon]
MAFVFISHSQSDTQIIDFFTQTIENTPGLEPILIDVNHDNREVSGTPYFPFLAKSLPEWFKVHAGNDSSAIRNASGTDCERRYQNANGAVENSLEDFDSNRMLLGCVLTSPFHNTVHRDVGQRIDRDGNGQFTTNELGDMRKAATAPLDPIFWRFHKFVDEVSLNRTSLDVERTLFAAVPSPPPSVMASLSRQIDNDISPPQLISQNPFRLNPFITDLPRISQQEKDLFGITGVEAISVEFSEPVSGVKPADFSVNGSFAKHVNGTGSGPYVFIGFDPPGLGPVNIKMSAGNITDTSGNMFGGDSWNYFIVEKDQDQDSDGARDDIEVDILLTNPMVNDTDEDTILDGFEATSSCLDPLSDDSHFMDITEIVSEAPLDSDNDGISNIQESRIGTNPCPQQESGDMQQEIRQGFAPDIINLLPNNRLMDEIGQEADEPFILAIEKTGGSSGENTKLSYNSITNRAVFSTDNNQTIKEVSESDEDTARRILNNSEFLDSNRFYPPAPNSTDYQEYTLIGSIGNSLNAVYWTSSSEDVPLTVQNLPYILANTFGIEDLF